MPAALRAPPLKQRVHWSDRFAHLGLLGVAALLVVGLVLPLVLILSKALEGADGSAAGMGAFTAYLASPALLQSLWHSVWVSLMVTAIVVPLAFTFAYALTRSCMPFKGLFRTITLIPLLAPSLLSAISLIYWFGNQGVAKSFWVALGFDSIYGPSGIVLAECFAAFRTRS